MTLPLAFFPNWLETLRAPAARSPRSCRCRSTSTSASTPARTSRRCSRVQAGMGGGAARYRTRSRSRVAPGSWWCRVAAGAFAVYCRLAGRATSARRCSTASRSCIDLIATFLISFLDFLAVLILFHNVPRLAGWSVHEVAFLYGSSAIAFALAELLVGHSEQLAMRLRTEPSTSCSRGRAARFTRWRRASCRCAGSAGRRRAQSSSFTRSQARTSTGRPVASQCCSRWCHGGSALRLDVGRGPVPPLLDGRRQRVLERVHLWRAT